MASINVMSSVLGEAGDALDIGEGDIARIKREARKRWIASRTIGWLTPILSFGAALYLSGAFKTDDLEQASIYPYAAAAVITNYKAFTQKTRFRVFGTIIVSAVAFVFGFMLGSAEPETLTTPRYGVLHDSMDRE